MKWSNWYSISICSACKSRMSENVKIYNSGLCPKCGHITKGTICDTDDVIIRRKLLTPWWQIINREFQYQGIDRDSQKYLVKQKAKNIKDWRG